jgi:hypothetical protein
LKENAKAQNVLTYPKPKTVRKHMAELQKSKVRECESQKIQVVEKEVKEQG